MSRFESIDVTRLRWFAGVAQELHFARAAQAMGISRQRLSRTVIELEEELDTKLFVPGAQPTQLTAEGEELLAAAREILANVVEEPRVVVDDDAERLRVGFVPGVTVTKWERIWRERFPEIPLEMLAVPMREQESALREGRVDMAFVRLPIDREGLSAIPLYRELPVVVVSKDHPISVFEQVSTLELADERMQDAADLDDAAMTMEMVAAVGGAAIVPHSIARLHSRKDLVYRTVTDVPSTEIVLAWPEDRTTELAEEFVGVVRGRSARSSRSPSGQESKEPQVKAQPRAGKKQPAGGKKPAAAKRGGAVQKPRKARGR
ncbi:LysR family transcriptional regulator [Nocardia sp. SYP-A9097]|uniref:LysR family transcriptional regulator n=1 Tax=Nocardia sp. SYP-A9097 TaxID=2663237 RepID=UPI00129C0421|nr:LysR family transcriptional regulator [Nocardia sp. SYP-A9097]MRH91615.1 LysR family transcriptional regulator [Nocardia sp. SYP-A9097]